mmetsp:Transcript_27123/g.36241  ORF Transcript_27123/g.36241 Transcript_27123/m.36241 type:complete len:133 (+) Transcript_27123:3-401(+)
MGQITMTQISSQPFFFPHPENVGEVVAPFVSALRYNNDEDIIVRVIACTNEDISGDPTFELAMNAAGQLTGVVHFSTSLASVNENPNIFWYGELSLPCAPDVDQVTVDAVDGSRPPKTSRGTIVTIQPTTLD